MRTALVLLVFSSVARADDGRYLAPPFLIDASLQAGAEPHDRGSPMAFGVGGEVLWRGLIGAGLSLYASEGSPIVESGNAPTFGDRVSVALAAAVRPLATLAWAPNHQTYAHRLAAGLGVQVGVSLEHARTSLESATNAGFHLAGLWDVPIWGGGSRGGLALRLSARLLVSPTTQFALQNNHYQVVEPGTAVQLLAGVAYYL